MSGKDLTTVWISDNIYGRLGYTVEEALDVNWWSNNINPNDFEKSLNAYENIITLKNINLEYRFLKKDRTEIWIYEEDTLIFDVDGNPVEVIGSWTDITKLKNAIILGREINQFG